MVNYSLAFYCWVYTFETVCKIIDGKIYLLIYLLTYLETNLSQGVGTRTSLTLRNAKPDVGRLLSFFDTIVLCIVNLQL